jgi:hypothetical protein
MTITQAIGGDDKGPAAERYWKLESKRTTPLRRARECARYTLPMLIPPDGASEATHYATPWQSLGARGVNNLAAKLLLTFYPANYPGFRYVISDYMLEQLGKKKADAETALVRMEKAFQQDIETHSVRAPFFEALKHLLVAGNVLLYIRPEGGLKVYPMDRYVIKRDPAGNTLEIITVERMAGIELPEDVQKLLGLTKEDELEKSVDVFTRVRREGTGWKVNQEVKGKEIPGSQGSYPKDKCPWVALRMIEDPTQDWGRSFVEEYLGDIKSLEGLSKAIVEAAAAAAKLLFLVKPNSSTDIEALANTESGGFAPGNAEDVTLLKLDKASDFRVALEMREQLAKSLSLVFMLNTAVQRDGERVTAQEIRYLAQELETGMGGFYSAMSQEWQLHFVRVRTGQLQKQGKLPVLPDKSIEPMITTGLDALGRGTDLNELTGFLTDVAPLGPEAIASNIDVRDFFKRVLAARRITPEGLIPTDEEIEQRNQQAQMQQMMDKLGPNAVTQLGGLAKEQMAQQQQQPQPTA